MQSKLREVKKKDTYHAYIIKQMYPKKFQKFRNFHWSSKKDAIFVPHISCTARCAQVNCQVPSSFIMKDNQLKIKYITEHPFCISVVEYSLKHK